MSELGPIFWMSLLLSLADGPPAPEGDALVSLEVEAIGFDSDHGHAIAALFRPGANVRDPREAFRRVSSEIRGGEATLRFPRRQRARTASAPDSGLACRPSTSCSSS